MEHLNYSIDNAKRMVVHLKPKVQGRENMSTKILARKRLDIIEWLCDYLSQDQQGSFMLVERFTCSSFSVQTLQKPSVSSAFSLLLSPSSSEEGVPDR